MRADNGASHRCVASRRTDKLRLMEDTASSAEDVCHICSDKATGKHYGAISCDGCKGFFRRSIRKRHAYMCRFNHNCDVDKSHRNSCRSCRLKKCIVAGMKADAIQSERDVIGRRKKNDSEEESTLLQVLLRSENLCQQLRGSVIKSTEQATYDTGLHKVKSPPGVELDRLGLASLDDVCKSMHQQLVLLVEWAKTLPPFAALELSDQARLLKANAAQLIVLGVAHRSVHVEDAICLGNDTFLTKAHAAGIGDIKLFSSVVVRIIEEVVTPMRQLNIDRCEYVALKAIIFFNPVSRGVNARYVVEEARRNSLKALQSRSGERDCRTGLLLLLLPPIHAIAQQLVEDVQLASLFSLANVDTLMQELILHDQPATIMHQLTNPFPHISK